MRAEGLIAPTGKGRGAKWVSLINGLQPQRLPRPMDTEEEKEDTQ